MRRVVLIALALSVPAAIAVFVPMWKYGIVKEPGAYVAGRHPPATSEERAAAGVALFYVRAAQRDDPRAACTVAVRRAARRLRCAAEARVPDALRPAGGRLTTIDARVFGGRGFVGISDGDRVNFLTMHRWHGIWRVAAHGRGFTL